MSLDRELAARTGAGEIPVGLRELRGPPAFGDDWRRFLRLLWRTTKLDWQARYQGSVLGYAWTILGPLLLALVLYTAFSRVIRFGGDIEHFQMVIIVGIILYHGFSDAASRALNSLLTGSFLLRQIDLPRLLLPMAAVATSFLTLSINLIPILGLGLVLGVEPTLTWLLVPVVVLGLLVITIPVAVLISVVNPRFRDIGHMWTAIARALFFASPVMIPIERYPESWQALVEWNPLAVVLAQARVWIVDPDAPSWADVVGGWGNIIYPLAVLLTLCILAVWAFRSLGGRVVEEM
jgi:ABC-2 type transport system permease protein